MADLISPLPAGRSAGPVPMTVPQGPTKRGKRGPHINASDRAEAAGLCCRVTGMGFARRRPRDGNALDRRAGAGPVGFRAEDRGQLKVDTTICHEIRSHRQPVVIDDVSQIRPMPRITRRRSTGCKATSPCRSSCLMARSNGTLCAVDAKPHRLNTARGHRSLHAVCRAARLSHRRPAPGQWSSTRPGRCASASSPCSA